MNRLPVLLLLLFGLSACGSTQTKSQFPNESSNSNIPPVEPTPLASTSIDTSTNNQSNKDLIIGKWRWIESHTKTTKDNPILTSKANNGLQAEIEYFEDNTYVEKATNWSENGEWTILSDGRIKKIHGYCTKRECKKAIRVNKISFPDSNTLYFDEKNDGSSGFYSSFSVYKRI